MAIRIEESPAPETLAGLEHVQSNSKARMWHKLHRFFSRDENPSPSPNSTFSQRQTQSDTQESKRQLGARRDYGRNIGVGLPRPATFKRQNSEKRHNLEPIKACPSERRAVSGHRQQRAVSAYAPRSKPSPSPQIRSRIPSAPPLPLQNSSSGQPARRAYISPPPGASSEHGDADGTPEDESVARRCKSPSEASSEGIDALARDEKHQIDFELDTKWILNLSMHFRDRSDREKFFITYAEKPNRWRRVTISCDYRNAELDSLETDLKELRYQRDKHAQIYESIRDSLSTVQFYNSVTNLKLQTESGRLHVHVTEDANETIPYPPVSSVQHIMTDRSNPINVARESDISFVSHLSGFVYKVSFQGREYIKKEIPGPDTVDEFLYEINALHALCASTCVIRLEAIVFDDPGKTIKGLLISYAEQGSVVDLLYDHRGELPWSDRVRWARQAVQGLSEIHEEGYVQGDFTLSNIVIDNHGDAKIIDINRRGCPVGWEPPEFARKIASNQRISMYIGQKSDLYQLGMTLWALAMQEDEPDRHQPLTMTDMPDEAPEWFREVVAVCLSTQPRDRQSAQHLLHLFPPAPSDRTVDRPSWTHPVQDLPPLRSYIDAVPLPETGDLERPGRSRRRSTSEGPWTRDASLVHPPSSSYRFESRSSFTGSTKAPGPHSRSHSKSANGPGSGKRRSDGCHTEACSDEELEPRIITISPKFEPSDENSLLDDRYFTPQDSRLTSSSTPQEHQASQQPDTSDDQRGITDSFINTEPLVHDLDLELPSPRQPVSEVATVISDSTPRNSNLETVPSRIPNSSQPVLDPLTADLAGLGGHPALEEHSPHEPMKQPDYHAQRQQNPLDSIEAPSPGREPASSANTKPVIETPATTAESELTSSSNPATSRSLSNTTLLEEKQLLPVPS